MQQRIKLSEYLLRTQLLVESEQFLQQSRLKETYFTRNRNMNFKELIYFMLTLVRQSTQTALDRYFDKIGKSESMSQQAFSTARHKISFQPFKQLFEMTAKLSYEGYYDTWNGYRVSAIDGSHINLPNLPKIRQEFGVRGTHGVLAVAQASVLYDVFNHVILDADLMPRTVDERTLALKHLMSLEKLGEKEKELLLCDRGYPSYELFDKLKEQNIRFVMRVQRSFNKDIDEQQQSDGLVSISRNKKTYLLRVIKFDLPSGEKEMLITDLFDNTLSVEDFSWLYFKRWGIETLYNIIKNHMELENFSGKTPTAIKQDFFATLYLANIVEAAAWDSTETIKQQRQYKDNKYEYQTNKNYSFGVLKDKFILAVIEPDPQIRAHKVSQILKRIVKSVTPVKPGRSILRPAKPRSSKFHHNMKSNC